MSPPAPCASLPVPPGLQAGQVMAPLETPPKGRPFDISRLPTSPTKQSKYLKTGHPEANLKDAWIPLDDFDTVAEFEEKYNCRIPTMRDFYNAVPPHCLVRSTWRSMRFLFRDILFAAVAALAAHKMDELWISHSILPVQIAFWALFALIQGTILIGCWVVGHECGHRGFSSNALVCDLVGWVVHSMLLVPYFSWQFTHGKHHKYTNHLIWGETHVPGTKKGRKDLKSGFTRLLGEDAFAVTELFNHLVIGWPAYLLFYLSGGRCSWKGERLGKKGPVDHFRGLNSQVFPPMWEQRVGLSSLGIFLVLAGCGVWIHYRGPMEFYIPHLGNEAFTWMRGALSTIDRPYPWLVDELHHHIGSTHVLHHVDFTIPHYHAVEATESIKKLLGPLYRRDDTPIWKATMHLCRTCHYVEDVDKVQYYRSRHDMLLEEKMKKTTPEVVR